MGGFNREEKRSIVTSTLNWKATERLVTNPVPTSDRSLANVKFRLSSGEPPTSDEIRHLDSPLDWDRFAPELLIDIDTATLTLDTGLPPETVAISVIVRDRELNRFGVIGEWGLDALPEDMWPLGEALNRFSRATRLDVAVVATACGIGEPSGSMPLQKGTLLASKAFKIRTPSGGLDLPIKFVEPEEMEKHGLDRRTVFYLFWKGEDVSRAPSDLIEVWLNREHEDKFRALSARDAGSVEDHIGRGIAAHLYGEVLTQVLSSDEDTAEPDSLINVVKELIERELRMTLGDAREVFRKGPDGRARLLPWCWKLAQVDRAFSRLTL